MTRRETADPSAIGPAPDSCTEADLARYAAAAAAADDPEPLMEVAEAAFRDMTVLTILHGDRVAAAGAAIVVQDAALQLCVSPAASEKAADDRYRFLSILLEWAWPRAPAVAATLEACRRRDRALWGNNMGWNS